MALYINNLILNAVVNRVQIWKSITCLRSVWEEILQQGKHTEVDILLQLAFLNTKPCW